MGARPGGAVGVVIPEQAHSGSFPFGTPVTATLELSCSAPSTCWRYLTLPALSLAVSGGHTCPGHHSQRSISPLAKGASCQLSQGQAVQ